MGLMLTGCGDFFAEKPTEMESENILEILSEIKPKPDIEYPVPEAYKKPPRIIEGKAGEETDAKVFYFCKYQSPQSLSKMIDNQFMKQFRNSKGKTYPVPDYRVTSNPATNQLVVRCPTRKHAEQLLTFLKKTDVPPIQVKIDCMVSEVYADHTMDWETTLQIENLFGEGIALGGKVVDGELQPAFPGAALRDVARSSFGLKAGFERQINQPGHRFRALVDLLASRGYLKILMNPQLEVVNGETARIETSEHVPLDEISYVSPGTDAITKSTRYVDIIDSLEITPHVFADGYIGLKTRVLLGSKSTPEGVKQVPIVTKREIRVEENRIRQGESLVIGGIRKTEKRSVVRGVPFLKDIPILGILFSSKDFEERGKEVLFIITPTISTGGRPNDEVIAEIRKKHEMVQPDTLIESLKDPFGNKGYTELVEGEAAENEVGRVKAEVERGHAQRKSEWLKRELRQANEQLEAERKRFEEAATEAEKARQELEKAKAEAEAKLQAEQKKTEQSQSKTSELQKQIEAARTKATEAEKRSQSVRQEYEAAAMRLEKIRSELEAAQNGGDSADAGKKQDRKAEPGEDKNEQETDKQASTQKAGPPEKDDSGKVDQQQKSDG
ncbi:type II secretion system protein GspD [Anaerohalosphaera lusitana]|nr:type II and III secretion system protein [Anaerohalosphaera lusitana]